MSSYLRVLRVPNFRNLFLGQAASVIGDRVVTVALALYITQTTGSASDLGLVLGAQALALVALLLFGGVWADRLPRQRIIIATDLTRAALHGLLAVLIFMGSVAIWQLVVIEVMFGFAQAFFQPAYTGLIPQTVPESLLQDAKAVTETMANLAFLIGPALATVLVLGVGAGEAFALDAATFLVSAVFMLRVHPRPVPAVIDDDASAEEPDSPSVLRELRDGWREVRSRTWVWVVIAAFAGAVMCVYAPWYALAPIIARDHYGGVGLFGVLESVGGVGAVVGALAALRWRPRHPLRAGMLLTLAWPIQDGLFALGAPVPAMIVSALATGFGFSLLIIWWETALARHIPPRALGRVSAWDWMGSTALLPLGYLIAGPLADSFGARTVLGVGAVIGVGLLALALVPRSVRQLGPGPDGSAEDLAGEVGVELGGETQVAHVDSLIGVMHERPGLK
jgi:MFS family permease